MQGRVLLGWLFLGGGAVFALQAITSLIGGIIASRDWPRVTARVVSRDAETVGEPEYGEPLWYATVRFGETTMQLPDTMDEAASRVGAKVELMHPPGQPLQARIPKGRVGADLLQLVLALSCAAIGTILR